MSRNITYSCLIADIPTTPCTVNDIIATLLTRSEQEDPQITITISAFDEAQVQAAALEPKNPLIDTQLNRITTQVVIDTTAPSITFLTDPPESSTNETTFHFAVQASELARFSIFLLHLDPDESRSTQYQVVHSTTSANLIQSVPQSQTVVEVPHQLVNYPHEVLSDGRYMFNIRAIDLAGNSSPARQVVWEVDTKPPQVIIEVQGNWLLSSLRTSSTTASFRFKAVDEPFATYDCAINCSPVLDCIQSLCTYPILFDENSVSGEVLDLTCSESDLVMTTCPTKLDIVDVPEGDHILFGRARDSAGNIGPVMAVEWSVDTTPPTAVIDRSPGRMPQDRTSEAYLTIFVEVDESESTLSCMFFRLLFNSTDTSNTTAKNEIDSVADGSSPFQSNNNNDDANNSGDRFVPSSETWRMCTSPINLGSFDEGTYIFRVRATDVVGNIQQARPLSVGWDEHTFIVDRTPPRAFVSLENNNRLPSNEPGTKNEPIIMNHVIHVVNFSVSEILEELTCTHCFQADSQAICRQAAVCDLDSGQVVAVAAGLNGEEILSIREDYRGLVPCQRAFDQLCPVDDLTIPGSTECPLGYLHECGVTQLSYSRACDVLHGMQQRLCIEQRTYTHWLELRMKDLAGNVANQRISTWIFGLLKQTLFKMVA